MVKYQTDTPLQLFMEVRKKQFEISHFFRGMISELKL